MANKGNVVNKPPLFKEHKYDYWKQRMIAFFGVFHIDMLDVVENPTKEDGIGFPRSSWNEDKKQEECEKVYSCKSLKEI
ncbi:hypothetical protein CR513_44606, partial [Mucuna pruriens]